MLWTSSRAGFGACAGWGEKKNPGPRPTRRLGCRGPWPLGQGLFGPARAGSAGEARGSAREARA